MTGLPAAEPGELAADRSATAIVGHTVHVEPDLGAPGGAGILPEPAEDHPVAGPPTSRSTGTVAEQTVAAPAVKRIAEPPPADDADHGARLADRLATAILDHADPTDPAQVGDHLALVRRCHRAEAVTKSLTQQAVDAARAAGHSWAEIGGELGMSRQAAQQRFGGAPEELQADERWLGPVTAFDELAELELAGRLGWHTVGAGMLRHRMVRTATQWEHRRLLWPQSTAKLLRDGWQLGCRAFPWIYLIRDTGLPAESD